MNEYLLINHMYRKAILTCQDGYGDDIKACRVAWDQYEEVRTAILRRNEKKQPPLQKKKPTDPNELSTREYDI